MAMDGNHALDWLATRLEWECIMDELHARDGREFEATEPECETSGAVPTTKRTSAPGSLRRRRSPIRGMSRRRAARRIHA
jgi:hypothetical protein